MTPPRALSQPHSSLVRHEPQDHQAQNGQAQPGSSQTPPAAQSLPLPAVDLDTANFDKIYLGSDIKHSTQAPIVGRTVDVSAMKPWREAMGTPDAEGVPFFTVTHPAPAQRLGVKTPPRSLRDIVSRRPQTPVWVESEMLEPLYAPAKREAVPGGLTQVSILPDVHGNVSQGLRGKAITSENQMRFVTKHVAPSSLYLTHFAAAIAAAMARCDNDFQINRVMPTLWLEKDPTQFQTVALYANTGDKVELITINTDSRVHIGDDGKPRALQTRTGTFELTYPVLENAFSKLIAAGGAYTFKPFDPLYRDTNIDAVGHALTAVTGAPAEVLRIDTMTPMQLKVALSNRTHAITLMFPPGRQTPVPPGTVPRADWISVAGAVPAAEAGSGKSASEHAFLSDVPYVVTHFHQGLDHVELLNVLKNTQDMGWYEEDATGMRQGLALQQEAATRVPLSVLQSIPGVRLVRSTIPYAAPVVFAPIPVVDDNGRPVIQNGQQALVAETRVVNGAVVTKPKLVPQKAPQHLQAQARIGNELTRTLLHEACNVFDTHIPASTLGGLLSHVSFDVEDNVVAWYRTHAPDEAIGFMKRFGSLFTWHAGSDRAAALEAFNQPGQALQPLATWLPVMAIRAGMVEAPEPAPQAAPQTQAAPAAAPPTAVTVAPQPPAAADTPPTVAMPLPALRAEARALLRDQSVSASADARRFGTLVAPPAASTYFRPLPPGFIAPSLTQTSHFAAALTAVAATAPHAAALRAWAHAPATPGDTRRQHTVALFTGAADDAMRLAATPIQVNNEVFVDDEGVARTLRVSETVLPGFAQEGSAPFHGYSLFENAFLRLADAAPSYAFQPFARPSEWDNESAISQTLSAVTGSPTGITQLAWDDTRDNSRAFWPGSTAHATLVTFPHILDVPANNGQAVYDAGLETPSLAIAGAQGLTLAMSNMPYYVVGIGPTDGSKRPEEVQVLLGNVLSNSGDPSWYRDEAPDLARVLARQGAGTAGMSERAAARNIATTLKDLQRVGATVYTSELRNSADNANDEAQLAALDGVRAVIENLDSAAIGAGFKRWADKLAFSQVPQAAASGRHLFEVRQDGVSGPVIATFERLAPEARWYAPQTAQNLQSLPAFVQKIQQVDAVMGQTMQAAQQGQMDPRQAQAQLHYLANVKQQLLQEHNKLAQDVAAQQLRAPIAQGGVRRCNAEGIAEGDEMTMLELLQAVFAAA